VTLAGLRNALFAALLSGCALLHADRPDNAAALALIHAHRSGDEVVVEGTVTRTERASHGPSGVHERFDVRIASDGTSQDIAVADNVSVGTAAPVRPGDDITVKGVLEIDSSGPVIHWTHHDPRFRHPGGYVIVHGTKYD
jgi:hypothetical protein